MISIYYNDRVLHLTDDINGALGERFDTIHQFSTTGDLRQFLKRFAEDQTLMVGYLYGDNLNAIIRHVKSYYKYFEAAGGLIQNSKGEYLFIYRLDKWDLPKGKLEKGEKPKGAALREVGEECGIFDVTLGRKLVSTYHTYPYKGKMAIKQTHWFEMQYDGDDKGTPQKSEGIERIEWRTKDNIKDIFENTYSSIVPVIEQVK